MKTNNMAQYTQKNKWTLLYRKITLVTQVTTNWLYINS